MLVLGWEHVVALIAALGTLSGVIAAVVSALANRAKVAAEASHEEAQAEEARASGAASLVASSTEFVGQVLDRVSALETSDEKKTATIEFLVAQNKELGEKVVVVERTCEQQRDVIDSQRTYIDELRERVGHLEIEIARYKRIVVRLFEWIRAQGLEPPTMEELERE